MANGKTDDQNGGTGDQRIKVGEKEYSTEDVQNLVSQVSANTEKTQQVSEILDAAKSYGLEPKEFLEQAVGGFNVISELIGKGVIDNQGNLIEKKDMNAGPSGSPGPKGPDPKETQGTGDPELDKLLNLDTGGDPGTTSSNKTEALVGQALNSIKGEVGKLTEAIRDVKDVQTSMIRKDFQGEIKAKFNTLDDEDVSKVFAAARNDRTKDIWQHAEELANAKTAKEVEIKKQAFKEAGLDYDKVVEENKLKESGPEGGGAPTLPKKKISFRPGAGEDTVTPLEASQEFLKSKLQE